MRPHPRKNLFRDDMELAEARKILREHVKEGISCPTCGQFAKVYRRKVNSTMARTLLAMYRAGAQHQFVHTPSLPGDTHEASQLAWWGLIVEERERRKDGGRTGWWQMTDRGVLWALDEIRIEKYARVYDGECVALEGERVSIRDALGQKFNYRDLMEGI